MWLLDVNMPLKTVALHGEYGIEAQTAQERGWRGLTNGLLVQEAVNAGFERLLTRDRLFGESASRSLRRSPEFAVVLVTLPQLREAQFLSEFRRAWRIEPIRPEAGQLNWPGC